MLLLAAVLGLLFLVVLALGSVSIPLEDIARVLSGSEASKPSWTNIILKVRLPKALTAMLAAGVTAIAIATSKGRRYASADR